MRRGGTEGEKGEHGRQRGTGQYGSGSLGVLLLPYVDETVLCKVKMVVRKSGLDVNIASYTPDTLKRELVHSSLTDPHAPRGTGHVTPAKALARVDALTKMSYMS